MHFGHKLITFAVGLAIAVGAQALPQVKILATGGTIAGTASSSTQMTGYKAGNLGVQVLINAVPQIKQYAEVSGEQVSNIGSENMTDKIWLKLAKRCNELLADPNVSGIVITHGTDTLEETAYFLNLTVHSDKPIVIVGAMRPATAISADGPINLLTAVKLAADPQSKGRGVLIAMNDMINGARDTTKTDTTNVATFMSPELGAFGFIASGHNYFVRQTTKRHTSGSEFDVSKLDSLPRVDIVYSHSNADRVPFDAFVKAGAKGIIMAGTGDGSVHEWEEPGIVDATKKGVIVIRSSRVPNGPVTESLQRYADEGMLQSGTLNPQKSRVLLQLALTKTNDPKKIQEYFEEY